MAGLSGEVPLGPTYVDLNAKRGTLNLKTEGQEKEENILVTYVEYLCKGEGPCRTGDYSHVKHLPILRETAYDQARAMGLEDDKHCFVLSTLQSFHKAKPRLLCIIDLNQEDNLMSALDTAQTMCYRDGPADNIPPADEGTVF